MKSERANVLVLQPGGALIFNENINLSDRGGTLIFTVLARLTF
jgi:hypothetical protein